MKNGTKGYMGKNKMGKKENKNESNSADCTYSCEWITGGLL